MHHFAASLAPPVGPVGDARASGIKPGPISPIRVSRHGSAARVTPPFDSGRTRPVARPGDRPLSQGGANAAQADSAPAIAPNITASGRMTR